MGEQKKFLSYLTLTDSSTEAMLFRQTVGDVEPIKKNNVIDPQQKEQPPIAILQKPSVNFDKHKNNLPAQCYKTPMIDQKSINNRNLEVLLEQVKNSTDGYVDRLHANLDELKFNRRGSHCPLFRRLRRGLLDIEYELDLHHYSINKAKYLTLESLLNAYENNLQCIKIIHGKGTHSKEGYSPIKYAVNYWLPQVPLVRAFHSCLPKDGGTGAIYVLIGG